MTVMMYRGRSPRIRARNAAIRAARAQGRSLKDIQREYGLDPTTISAICHGRLGYVIGDEDHAEALLSTDPVL